MDSSILQFIARGKESKAYNAMLNRTDHKLYVKIEPDLMKETIHVIHSYLNGEIRSNFSIDVLFIILLLKHDDMGFSFERVDKEKYYAFLEAIEYASCPEIVENVKRFVKSWIDDKDEVIFYSDPLMLPYFEIKPHKHLGEIKLIHDEKIARDPYRTFNDKSHTNRRW